MIIGNPDTFAITFEVDQPATEWLFGKFAYVAGAAVIGSYEDGCTLRAAIGAMRNLLTHRGNRMSAHLMALTAVEVFHEIDRALYVDERQPDDQVAADRARYWRFQVKEIGLDVFDGWKCYLVESPATARFLWCDQRTGDDVHEVSLLAGQFDRVALDFVEYIEEAYGMIMWP